MYVFYKLICAISTRLAQYIGHDMVKLSKERGSVFCVLWGGLVLLMQHIDMVVNQCGGSWQKTNPFRSRCMKN